MHTYIHTRHARLHAHTHTRHAHTLQVFLTPRLANDDDDDDDDDDVCINVCMCVKMLMARHAYVHILLTRPCMIYNLRVFHVVFEEQSIH